MVKGGAAAAVFLALFPAHAAYDLRGLGFLSGGTESVAYGISGDGGTVVGYSNTSQALHEATKWTLGSDTITLTPLGGLGSNPVNSLAYGVNVDGTLIVGTSDTANDETHAFSFDTAIHDLGMLSQTPAELRGVDDAGTVAAGSGKRTTTYGTFVRPASYTFASGTWTDLGNLFPSAPDYGDGAAYAVSADGQYIVGKAAGLVGTTLKDRAFRTKVGSGEMEDLGSIGPAGEGGETSTAYGVNRDGSIVVGSGTVMEDTGGDDPVLVTEAFIWDSDSQEMNGLGDLPGGGFRSEAFDVSADGTVIVGVGRTGADTDAHPDEAFVYFTRTGQMELLSSVLVANGVDLSGWQQLLEARAISDDGTRIAGVGLRADGVTQEAFVATIEVPELENYGWFAASMLLGMGLWRRCVAKRP